MVHGRAARDARRCADPHVSRNCLAYVLNTWRHHREHRTTSWLVDKYSPAIVFDGWKELGAGALHDRARRLRAPR
jgi:hypothetical protein